MTAYEFTKIDVDFTSKVKAQAYEARALAGVVASKDASIRTSEKYEEAKDAMIDTTMSCDEEEAKSWMKWYMVNAIAYGIKTQDRDWRYFFIAAYDILCGLCK